MAVDRSFETPPAGSCQRPPAAVLQGGRRGVEKESLQGDPEGRVATTLHPTALGRR